MPLYDYRCAACGRVIEVMHGIDAAGPQSCEACGGAMKKVLSPPAIHFKGSGWAKKDASAATAKKASPKAASPGADKSGTPAESKGGSAAESTGTSGGSTADSSAGTSSTATETD